MSQKDYLSIFTVYKHPKDYPTKYVIRESRVYPGGQTGMAVNPTAVEDTLEKARLKLPEMLTRINRHAQDDPNIVECWL